MSRLWPVTDGCTDPFKDGFKNELDQNGYDLNFVYSAGETGLNWKSLPSKFLASQRKKKPAPGYKTRASTNITLR